MRSADYQVQAQLTALKLEIKRMSNDFTKLQTAVADLQTSLASIGSDVTKLLADVPAAIKAAAASGSTDQPTIDAITQSLTAVHAGLDAAASSLAGLDASVAPAPAPAA